MHRKEILIIVSAAVIVYLNSFRGTFQLDDYNVIVFNPVVHSWPAWWADTVLGIRPFLKFVYTLAWTSGAELFGFHLINIAVHTCNSILVYALSNKFLEGQKNTAGTAEACAPFITALLFALHPIQTEAVTYISGGSAALMSVFYLGSILAYAHGRDVRRPALTYILSPLLFLVAVAAKEVALTLPAALVLWELTKKDTICSFRNAFKSQWVHWGLLSVTAFVIFIHPRYSQLIAFSINLRSIHDSLLSQIHGTIYLLSRLFFIHRLNIDPDLPVITAWSVTLALEAAFLVFLIVMAILCRKKYAFASFGIFWFFLQLLPVNTLIPRIDIINERHFYLPGWGIFFIFSAGAAFIFSKFTVNQRYLRICIILLCLTLGAFTLARNHVYRSEITLWEDTALRSPGKARVFNNLGYAYYLAGRLDEAKKAYLRALQLDPRFDLVRNNLLMIDPSADDKASSSSIR